MGVIGKGIDATLGRMETGVNRGALERLASSTDKDLDAAVAGLVKTYDAQSPANFLKRFGEAVARHEAKLVEAEATRTAAESRRAALASMSKKELADHLKDVRAELRAKNAEA